MIARIWNGTTRREDTATYTAYLQETGVPELAQTPGNRGVFIMHDSDADYTHFTLISLWESREAIHAFAGDDISRAVYYPEDARFLIELNPTVDHREIAVWHMPPS
jgi:heme-degrading monooxygenase HmoA